MKKEINNLETSIEYILKKDTANENSTVRKTK